MIKKISTSLFLIMYMSVSTLSFAEEVMLEIIAETPPVVETVPAATVVEDVPVPPVLPPVVSEEIVTPETPPVVDIVPPPVVSGDIPVPVVEDVPVPPVLPPVVPGDIPAPQVPPPVVPGEIVTPPVTLESILDTLLAPPIDVLPAAPEEIIEELSLVKVEEYSPFTPPGPEPEPWQPTVVDNTVGIPEGRGESQSDPAFLEDNSALTQRMIENIQVDTTAKHSCKADVFRTDISKTTTSILVVKFYGTSLLAAYDAQIGGLPIGIDVRFAKNNDYIYGFRGKETTLELIINNQEGSLSGDFTIPIIYTYKGQKESTVICQFNIINKSDEGIFTPLLAAPQEVLEPVIDPVQEFVEELLEETAPEPVIDVPLPTMAEDILKILIPELPPISPPVEPPPIVVPEKETGPVDPPLDIPPPPEPVIDPVVPVVVEPDIITEPIITPEVIAPVPEPVTVSEPVPEIVTPVIENIPAVAPLPISSSDVSST